MVEVETVVASIAGGSLFGALVGHWQWARSRTMTRRGRARLVHEDLYRAQSMITRIYYQTEGNGWGEEAWLAEPLADKEDQQDVLARLRGWRLGVCAGALGWLAYLRRTHGEGKVPSHEELWKLYARLAWGRLALTGRSPLSGVARMKYGVHDPQVVVPSDDQPKDRQGGLRKIEYPEAIKGAKKYREEPGLRSGEKAGADQALNPHR